VIRFIVLSATTLIASGMTTLAGQNVDPTGTYAWEVDFQGQVIAGTFEISGEEGEWTGVAQSDVGPGDITAVEVDGTMITLTVASDQGDIIIELEMDGDDFTGTGTAGFDTFTISGHRTTG